MVKFMCQTDMPQGAQIKHHFWVCLWGCFQLRLTFESVDSVCPPQYGWVSSNMSVYGWKNPHLPLFPASPFQQRHFISFSPALGHKFTPLAQLVLRPLSLGWIIPLAFLDIQFADCGTFQSHNFMNHFLIKCLFTYIVLSPYAYAVTLSCPTLCDPWSMDFPGNNTGLGCHFPPLGNLLNPEIEPHFLCLLYCWQIIYPLSPQGSPCLHIEKTYLLLPVAFLSC